MLKKSYDKAVSILWKIAGFLAVALGFVGVFLPLLPTVPFLLLAVFCFSKGSPRMFRYILNNKWIGPPLREYRDTKSVRMSIKISTLSFLWISLLASVIFFIDTWWLRILLLVMAVTVTIHVASFPTLRKNKDAANAPQK